VSDNLLMLSHHWAWAGRQTRINDGLQPRVQDITPATYSVCLSWVFYWMWSYQLAIPTWGKCHGFHSGGHILPAVRAEVWERPNITVL